MNKNIIIVFLFVLLSCINHYETTLLSADAQKSLDIIKSDMDPKKAKELQSAYMLFYKYSTSDFKLYLYDKYNKKPEDVTIQDLLNKM